MSDRTTMDGEVSLLARLRHLWETIDPAPDDLADRVLFALELEDLDTDFELLRLTERGDALAGTRAGAASASRVTHITFASANVSVMLAVGPAGSAPADGQLDGRRIDGWIAPAAASGWSRTPTPASARRWPTPPAGSCSRTSRPGCCA